MLKTNASKPKSQIRILEKPLGFSKKAPTEIFLEFYLVYHRSCFETSTVKIANVTNSRFWTILAQIGFPFFDPLEKKMFSGKVYIQKIPLNILKPLFSIKN